MAVQYDSKNNSWNTWIDTFKNKIPTASNEAKDTFTKIKEQLEQGLSVDNWDDFIKNNNLADESLTNFLKDANYGTKDLANYQQYLRQATSTFADFTKKAGSVLKSFSADMMSIGVNWLISEAIGAATITFGNLINTS